MQNVMVKFEEFQSIETEKRTPQINYLLLRESCKTIPINMKKSRKWYLFTYTRMHGIQKLRIRRHG